MNPQETAKQIVESVGGIGNINSVYHCITRLRFDLKDQGKADQAALKQLDKVMGTNIAGDQFQVIVGSDVSKVYDAMTKEYPALKADAAPPAAGTAEDKKKGNPVSRLFDFIAGVFAPILPAIAGAGLMKGLVALFVSWGWMTAGTDTYLIISAIGDGVFYFLPVLIAISASRKFGANPYVGVAVVSALLYPDLIALLGSGEPVSFVGIPVTAVSYASSVIPILLAVWLMSYVERGVNKIIPASLKLLLVPLITLLLVVPVTLIVIGPLGTFIGGGLSGGINWLLAEGGLFAGLILGGAMALIVMTGMHYALVPVILSNLATLGVDKFLPLTYISNMGQAGATFGVFLRAKDKKLKSVALSTSVTALMGVTEPAMYGVNMTYKKPFLAGMIGSAAGGAFAMAFGVNAYVLAGNGGIPGLPALIGPTFVYALEGLGIAFVVAAVVSFILGIKEEIPVPEVSPDGKKIVAAPASGAVSTESERLPAASAAPAVEEPVKIPARDETIYAPMTGRAIPLTDVNDPTFGDELMGKGIAFVPSEGILASPVDGTVMNVFKTKHAIVVHSVSGAELLIHVGINTVKLRGQYFEAQVQAGDVVKAGDPLLTFDLARIAEEYDTTTAMVVTNTGDYASVEALETGGVSILKPVLKVTI
ncbi:beta-glucoside-specific PTS transporter subunit IIABC [Saccharibacillus sp. CPCC 101409]|uniref:beta-glucoside-specific PTS transporter subunit IIABC n=1 Tax=Saccharibacillus sp. CPCC 101409 TaxID=3058041 RepID=UPI0026730D6D|nr:beta-glucoside-specific PTS transporter subunit IIABC [Saccharibacillus sp. CPCC 101409]MDO3408505.1 beta-glucoside-specific PTS transporter subunit IIABC [Saccharibacillus sp. CPCC 101409]